MIMRPGSPVVPLATTSTPLPLPEPPAAPAPGATEVWVAAALSLSVPLQVAGSAAVRPISGGRNAIFAAISAPEPSLGVKLLCASSSESTARRAAERWAAEHPGDPIVVESMSLEA